MELTETNIAYQAHAREAGVQEASSELNQPVPEAQTEKTETVPETRAFSAFSENEKLFIVMMVSLASFFSLLSGQIYYPVMPTLVDKYHLTTELVNLTITTYMILQGLAPIFMGTFADTGGRRPAYIVAFAIYTAANIGLALQNSFAALLVLRCIQSAGISSTVPFGYGVVVDIATTAERGKYIGPMSAGVNVAPALGPVIGGLLAQFLGWRSVFWFLAIISGGYLVFFVLFMPETARKVVGDGGSPPTQWWRRSVIQWWSTRQTRSGDESHLEETSQHQSRRTGLRFPNPLMSFAVLLERDALIIIAYVGLILFSTIALLTSTANHFGDLYGFNELQIGLCFLPFGISACFGSILYGKVIDHNYKRIAQRLGLPIDRKKGYNLRGFPVEHARLQLFFPVMTIGIAALIPYGWVLQQRVNLAAPLVLQFIMGFCFVAALNCLNALVVDLFPDKPATAAAASNLVRCWLGAIGAAVINRMMGAMGWGWSFVFLGLTMAAAMGLLWVEMEHGMGWREKRFLKAERKKASSEAQVSTEEKFEHPEQKDDYREVRTNVEELRSS
ncbi:unnamed protein product [Penicillium salamii]|nr:unnamed protein product [Penicillium salamii]